MNLPVIKQIAQAELGNRRSHPFNEMADKYTHGERVAVLAKRLREIVLPDENSSDDILTVAAWFHDVCNGMDNHAVRGAERTKELLAGYCPVEELEQICNIIAVHDDRKPGSTTHSDTVKIHQDADVLDHLGTMDIWRLVAYTIGHDETVNDALQYLQDKWPEDNVKWRSTLNYDLSRKIFDEKSDYMKSFTSRFAIESAGGICLDIN